MPYIGRDLRTGAFRQLDDISSGFDGSDTTHTMQVNSTNVSVGDVNQILLSLGGVIQKPGTDFTVSGSTLTFTTAPAANTSFFAILLGSDNGGTVTPTDASVTTAKLSGNLVTPGTLDVNGQELILDADADTSITADTDDQIDFKTGGTDRMHVVSSGHLSVGASSITNGGGYNKVIQVSGTEGCFSAISSSGEGLFAQNGANTQVINRVNGYMEFRTNNTVHQTISADGEVTKPLQPCFRVGSGTQDNIPVSSNQDAVFSNEIFDIGNNFASNVFTAPVTGKYYLNAMFRINNLDTASSYLQVVILGSNRNTTIFTLNDISDHMSGDSEISFSGATILDMDANDTASVRIRIQAGTAQADVNNDGSYFTGYLIG